MQLHFLSVTLNVALFLVVLAISITDCFNVESVKTFIVKSSKREKTPWTKCRKEPGPKKKEKGEHLFDERKKKELGVSDRSSWFDQP